MEGCSIITEYYNILGGLLTLCQPLCLKFYMCSLIKSSSLSSFLRKSWCYASVIGEETEL